MDQNSIIINCNITQNNQEDIYNMCSLTGTHINSNILIQKLAVSNTYSNPK